MVLLITALMAVVTSPQLESFSNIRAYYAIHKLRSDVRYTQLLAVGTQARARIVFDSLTDHYQIERETSPGTWAVATHPATQHNYETDFNTGDYQGVDITSVVLGPESNVIFDSLGAPYKQDGVGIEQPAYLDLNSKYRLNFRAETGKLDFTIL